MENQHRKISGYRELSQEEIDLMNSIKKVAADVGALLDMMSHCDSVDTRWYNLARDELQSGFMKAVRAVAQPTTF